MPKTLSIRDQLRGLVLVTAAPLILFALAIVLWHNNTQQELVQQQAVRTGVAAMEAVDRELSGAITGLQVLAASPALADGDLAAFHAQAKAAVGIAGNTVIVLLERSGDRLVSTAAPFGTALPRRLDMSAVGIPFETGKPHLTRLFISETNKRPVLGIVVPVILQGQVRYVLGAGLASERLSALLRQSGLPADWPAVVLDQDGTIIARSAGPEYIGQKALPENWERIRLAEARSGIFGGTIHDGQRALIAFARSGTSGWFTVVAIPAASIHGQLYQSLAFVAAAGAIVLAVALVLAWRSANEIAGPVVALRNAARAMQEGQSPDVERTGIEQLDALAQSMHEAAAQIRQREGKLSESLAELREAHAQLRDEQAKKDQFIATLAHELRNPLAPIRTGVFVLQKHPSGAAAARTLSMMERQLSHMVRLIEDLLDVSRIARGKLVLQRESIVLQDVIADACAIAESLLQRGGHAFTMEVPAEPICLAGDRTRLAQVLANVLNNAAKFTPAGGSVRLQASTSQDCAEVRITDSGIGIPSHRLTDIFDVFTQVSDESLGRQPGLGIGLSLAKLLVQLHGGSIEGRSEGRGQGSTFLIRIPRAPCAADHPASEAPRTAAPAHGRRLLVVDDNRDAADTLGTLLCTLGHSAQVAHDGSEALDLALGQEFDLIFLDIGMPGMDGYEVCRRLRGMRAHAATPIVALTGWGAAADRELGRQAGFTAHLVKPASLDELERTIGELAPPRGGRDAAALQPVDSAG